MKLQAVIFDMDGVLTNTVEYHYRSWKEILDSYDIPFNRQDNEKLLGLTRRRSLEVVLGGRQMEEEQIQEILKLKNEAFQQSLGQMGPEDLLPGVVSLMKEIRASDLLLGVASASQNAPFVLQKLGIARYFDTIIDGSKVQRSKPAPDIYLRAAKTLRVSPGECLVIEDSEAGVRAALGAGMCVIGVGSEKLVGRAHAIFPDLSRVRLRLLMAVYELWRTTLPVSPADSYTQAAL